MGYKSMTGPLQVRVLGLVELVSTVHTVQVVKSIICTSLILFSEDLLTVGS